MDLLSGRDVKEIFTEIRDEMIKSRDLLFELDAAMGDGDLGVTMSEGFSKAVNSINEVSDDDIGGILIKAGMTMAAAAPSTMGTLMATAIMRAGKEAREMNRLTSENLVKMGRSAIDGIVQRGKASKGDKTVLDSLIPAIDAMEDCLLKGGSPAEAFKCAYNAAAKGAESTREMKSVHGRGVWYGENSIGKQDPGATAAMLIFKALDSWMSRRGESVRKKGVVV